MFTHTNGKFGKFTLTLKKRKCSRKKQKYCRKILLLFCGPSDERAGFSMYERIIGSRFVREKI